MKKLIAILFVFLINVVWAARIDKATAESATENWIKQNDIARSLFSESKIVGIKAYDSDANLWIANLSPCGYIILSGSDLRKPVIAFSQNDFIWPENTSPFAARLNATALSISNDEATGGTRHEEWASLIGGRVLLKAAKQVASSNIIVQPFMTNTYWNQSQPFNDFSPIYDSSLLDDSYRGRTPCGCIATAFAQVLAYWKWPYSMNASRLVDHEFYPNGDYCQYSVFPIRFDGHIPFDWDSLSNKYARIMGRYDLRGKVSESVRYPVARLILFAGSLAEMIFSSDGSASEYYTTCAAATEWYTSITATSPIENYDLAVSRIKSDLQERKPVFIAINGHAIIAHGWAENGDNTHYVYHNYGWGGANDGWYLLCGGSSGEDVRECYTGFYPKNTVQIEPISTVSSNDVTINWHVPNCYSSEVTGFEVKKSLLVNSLTSMVDNFSAKAGDFSDELNVDWKEEGFIHNRYISFDPRYANTYTYANIIHLTSQSELSFRFKSSYALDSRLVVQVSAGGGDWKTILTKTPTESGVGSWETVRLSLGDKGGESVQLRFGIVRVGYTYYTTTSRCICIDDVKVNNILSEENSTQVVASSMRSYSFSNLISGGKYSFSVTPIFANNRGVASSLVQTRIEGTSQVAIPSSGTNNSGVAWTTKTFTKEEDPVIVSVTNSVNYAHIAEGFYRENAIGSNILWVTCSRSVTTLKAFPSHLALLSDDDIEIISRGNGEYVVIIKADVDKIPNRSRMILTLEAKNENGTATYKDLSLRFDEEVLPETYAVLPSVIDVPTTMFSDITSVQVPIEWFVTSGLIQSGQSVDYVQLANADSDGDGFSNLAEYVCGTSPINALDRLQCFIEMINGAPHITHNVISLPPGFRAVIKGSPTIVQPNWQPQASNHRFFKVVIESENNYVRD